MSTTSMNAPSGPRRPASATAAEPVPMLIGAAWRHGTASVPVTDPYDGSVVALAPESSLADLDDALAAARGGAAAMAAMPGHARAALLRRVGSLLRARTELIAQRMAREIGKAIKDARAEVARAAETIELAAEDAVRIAGEQVPLDASAMGAGRIALTLRFPVGVVAGITPFNAPFNLACHKVAPTLAAGNAISLKPPPQAPLTVHRLVDMVVEAGAPTGALGTLYGHAVGPALVRDPRVDFISFTGSAAVGAQIKAASGQRRVALELGGDGRTIVHHDANVPEAARVCARDAMRLAGQSCISVQHVLVHESIAEPFVGMLVAAVQALGVGDPLDAETDVGTLIDEAAARRVEAWVAEAVAGGARLQCGGRRTGAQYTPTVLTHVTADMRVVCEEVFGPVVSVRTYADIDEAFAAVNGSRYGLQCGVFTRALETAIAAVRALRVGGVILNGSSTWRTDQMPYGGVRDSGIGREGPRFAIREMTDERLVVFNV